MTLDEYVSELAFAVDPRLVEETKDWSTENKMYVYLHNIQLSFMSLYMDRLIGEQPKGSTE